jgi:hypothetical protein
MKITKPEKPETFDYDLDRLPEALEPLTQEQRWVNWRWVQRDEKWTKPPFQPSDPRSHAKANDPQTWGSYSEALSRYKAGDGDGIGFMLLGSSIGAVDLDRCCHVDDENLDRCFRIDSGINVTTEPWARKLCEKAPNFYRELTVSGTGQRLIGIAHGAKLDTNFPMGNTGRIELYRNTPRFITISGLDFGKCSELPSIDDFLDSLLHEYKAADGARTPSQRTDFDQMIRDGVPRGQRSDAFHSVVGHLRAKGLRPAGIVDELSKHPHGIAAKYIENDRLEQEVKRSYERWENKVTGISLDDFLAYSPARSYIFIPTGETWPAGSVNTRVPSPSSTISTSTWLDQNQAVEQMTWAPGMPQLIQDQLIADGGWSDRKGCRVFNLYRPPTIVPRAGAVDLWRNHLHRLYGSNQIHIEQWFAHRVQWPGEKINHALLLGGPQGIGKDTLLEPIKQAVGAWNFGEVSPQHLLGRFNGCLRSVILRVSEARDLGERDRFIFYEHMKTCTAAPPNALRIDEKFKGEYYIPNVVGIVITTNYKTDGIYLPADDRRHFVAWSDVTKDEFDGDYWNKIWKWYGEGGYEHVAHYLANLDLSAFNPKAPPPKTTAFHEIVDASRVPEASEMADTLDKLDRPDAVTIETVRRQADAAFGDWLDDRRNTRRILHRFAECDYTPVRNPDAHDGLWKIGGKRQAVYAKQDLSQHRRLEAVKNLVKKVPGARNWSV